MSIQFKKFVTVAHGVEEFDKVLVFNHNGRCVVVRMEAEPLCLLEVLVDKHVDVVLRVVDKSEGGDAAGFQPEIFVHTRFRGEAKFPLMEAVLQVVDIHLVHALEQHEIVFVTFMIPEKQVLAVGGVEFFPVIDSLLNGGDGWMEMDVELDAKFFQGVNDFLLPFAHFVGDFGRMHISRFQDFKIPNFKISRLQGVAGIGFFTFFQIFRGAFKDDIAAFFAAFGT